MSPTQKRTASTGSVAESEIKRLRTNGTSTSTTASPPEEADKHSIYTHWSLNQGIIVSNVGPRILPGRGVGLLATGPIKANSQLIFVNETSMIKTNINFLKRQKLQKASPQAQLAAHLTLASRVAPCPDWYQNSRAVWPTPEDFKACMLAWSDPEEMDVLTKCAPPSILSPLERLLSDLRKDVKAVEHLHTPDDAAWVDEYTYHWILVNTRSFHWKPEGVKEGSMVMCPFLDYMNHCPNGHGVGNILVTAC